MSAAAYTGPYAVSITLMTLFQNLAETSESAYWRVLRPRPLTSSGEVTLLVQYKTEELFLEIESNKNALIREMRITTGE
jgi:hypothetical protein